MKIIRIKKLYIFIFNCWFILLSANAFSIDAENIIAYPVPFNPKIHHVLRIGYKPGPAHSGSINSIKVEIYDINGDRVFTREYNSITNVIWNGRNGKGKIVKPGMYILKISLEDTVSGTFGRRIIRILVNQ